MWFAVIVPLQFGGGWGGTQILFKKQEDSLAVKLCSVCVIPFPPFHEFFRADQHLFSTTVFFLFFFKSCSASRRATKRISLQGRGWGEPDVEENGWREGEEREEKSTTGRPLKNKKINKSPFR